MNCALAATAGIEQTARKGMRDPLGMIGSSCVVSVAAMLTAACDRAVRSRFVRVKRPGNLLGVPFGCIFGATMVFGLFLFGKLTQSVLDSSIRISLPPYFDLLLLIAACIVASILAVEFEQVLLRRRSRTQQGTGNLRGFDR